MYEHTFVKQILVSNPEKGFIEVLFLPLCSIYGLCTIFILFIDGSRLF